MCFLKASTRLSFLFMSDKYVLSMLLFSVMFYGMSDGSGSLQIILLTRWGREGVNVNLGDKDEPTVLSTQCNANVIWFSFLMGIEKNDRNQWPQSMH